MCFSCTKLSRMKINSFIVFIAGILLTSCFDPPDYPDTPRIEYRDVLFKNVGDNSDPDSLVISIRFEDGDGDLGLRTTESAPPFQLKNFYSNKTGQLFNFAQEPAENLMTLSDVNVIDTLPPYEDFYRCIRWDTQHGLTYQDGTPLTDTVYFQFNKRYHNIYIDYFVLENGAFQKFDWKKEIDCSVDYNGRFPLLNDDPDKKRVLEGNLRYGMVSTGFKNIFGNKTMKLRIQISDRKGHFSNIIETPEFTLSEIQVN